MVVVQRISAPGEKKTTRSMVTLVGSEMKSEHRGDSRALDCSILKAF